MKALRVAMVAPPWLAIPPVGYGGIENVIAALVPELIKLGVKVELFSVGQSTLKSTKKHWLFKEGQYDQFFKPMIETSPIVAAHILFALNQIKEDGGFDIIHDHNNIIGPLTAYFSHPNLMPPMVHTMHNPGFSSKQNTRYVREPEGRLLWRQVKNPTNLYLVSISNFMTRRAPRAVKPHIVDTVYDGVILKDFPQAKKRSDYFMTLAGVHPGKGQAIAVKACLELGYRLKMAGGVGHISSARRLMLELANPLSPYRHMADFRYFSDRIFPFLDDGQIENLGEVQGKRKLELLSHAKALLFPAQWDEPFGMAAIEALACGIPVVAMAKGALPEIIEHGVNGFLAKTYPEFKHFMARVDEIDPKACRASVRRKFSAEVMAQNYLKVYRQVRQLSQQSQLF